MRQFTTVWKRCNEGTWGAGSVHVRTDCRWCHWLLTVMGLLIWPLSCFCDLPLTLAPGGVGEGPLAALIDFSLFLPVVRHPTWIQKPQHSDNKSTKSSRVKIITHMSDFTSDFDLKSTLIILNITCTIGFRAYSATFTEECISATTWFMNWQTIVKLCK